MFSIHFAGKKTSNAHRREDETPSSEANGHVPHDSISRSKTESDKRVSETTSDNEPLAVEQNVNNGAISEQQLNEEDGSRGEVAATQQETAPESSSSRERVSSGEQRPVVAASSASVGDEAVALVTGADGGKENDVEEAQDASGETSASGKRDSVSHTDTREVSQGTSPGGETAQHRNTSAVSTSNRNTSQVSLSGDKDTVPGQVRKGSMTVSEYFGAPSEEDVNLSRQSLGTSHQNITKVNLADQETPAARDTSEGNLSSRRSTSKASLSGERDTASHSNTSEIPASNRNASQVSLSKDAVSGQEQTVRKESMTVSEYFGAHSEEDVNLSRQSLGTSHQKDTPAVRDTSEGNLSSHRTTSKASLSSEKEMAPHSTPSADPASNRNASQASLLNDKDTVSAREETMRKDSISRESLGSSQQNILPTTTEVALPVETSETTKEDSASLEGKQMPAEQNVHVSGDGHPSPTRRDSSVSNENVQGRICTVTANVRIGSLENPEGQQTVTLSGSVYRVAKEEGDPTTPNTGDRIGIVKGEVTSTPIDNESSEKLATLRGDLFAVSGEAVANGLIATASIDVLSCNSGKKIATITADVTPSDDPEHQSGIITGEVLAGTENGSYDEKIGSLSGKVVALTFDEDIPLSIGNIDD